MGESKAGPSPSLQVETPHPEGLTDHLAELKFINAGISWYVRGAKGRVSDRRAAKAVQDKADSFQHQIPQHSWWSDWTSCKEAGELRQVGESGSGPMG